MKKNKLTQLLLSNAYETYTSRYFQRKKAKAPIDSLTHVCIQHHIYKHFYFSTIYATGGLIILDAWLLVAQTGSRLQYSIYNSANSIIKVVESFRHTDFFPLFVSPFESTFIFQILQQVLLISLVGLLNREVIIR